MHKAFFAAVLSLGLMTIALPSMAQNESVKGDTAKPAKTKKPPSAAQAALHERMKKCGAEWKAAKADGKIEKGMKWPKYWSACNKRLKAAGG